MPKKLTVVERIERLEQVCPKPSGTVLSRCMEAPPKQGVRWNLGLGKMHSGKKWFTADTIEGCLTLAEKAYLKE